MLAFLLICFLSLGTDKGNAMDNKKQKISKHSTWRIYLEESGQRMVLTTEKNDEVSDCYAIGDETLIKNILQVLPNVEVLKVNGKAIHCLTDYCTKAKLSNALPGMSGEEVWQEFGIFGGMFIYPGTKWCGAGNISESYDDLGQEVEADVCCRDHDHCNDSIEALGTKYGLDNNSAFTKSHCNCDDEFNECLKEANTRTSNRIGSIYFNYLQIECFNKEHPILTCNKYHGWFRPRCQEYEFDEEQDPIWQWFDAQLYRSKSKEKKDKKKNKDVFGHILKLEPSNYCRNDTFTLKVSPTNYCQ